MSKFSIKLKAQEIAKELFLESMEKCKSQSDFLDVSERAHDKISKLYSNEKVALTTEFDKKWVALWIESPKKNMVYLDTIGKVDSERKRVFATGDTYKIKRFLDQLHDQPELDKSFTEACKHNNLEIVEFLYKEKNCMGHLIYDDLMVAIESAACEVLEFLMEDEVDINQDNGAAFYKACRSKDYKMKCMVLDYGYDFEQCPSYVPEEDKEWAISYLNSKQLHESLDATLKSGSNQKKMKI